MPVIAGVSRTTGALLTYEANPFLFPATCGISSAKLGYTVSTLHPLLDYQILHCRKEAR
jgi:hypothetical protein